MENSSPAAHAPLHTHNMSVKRVKSFFFILIVIKLVLVIIIHTNAGGKDCFLDIDGCKVTHYFIYRGLPGG